MYIHAPLLLKKKKTSIKNIYRQRKMKSISNFIIKFSNGRIINKLVNILKSLILIVNSNISSIRTLVLIVKFKIDFSH